MPDKYEDEPNELAVYLSVFRRRYQYFVIPLISVTVISFLLALFWPARYLSTAKIMVDNEKLLDDIVLPTSKGSGTQRILTIQQQLLTTARIKDIIERLDLYPDSSDLPAAQLAQKFRDNVYVHFVDEDIVDPRSGRSVSTTIAFLLGFYGDNPDTVQQVAAELVKLFMEENESIRKKSTLNPTVGARSSRDRCRIALQGSQCRCLAGVVRIQSRRAGANRRSIEGR